MTGLVESKKKRRRREGTISPRFSMFYDSSNSLSIRVCTFMLRSIITGRTRKEKIKHER